MVAGAGQPPADSCARIGLHDPHRHQPECAADGSVYVWLDPGVLARLKALRGPGESYSDVSST